MLVNPDGLNAVTGVPAGSPLGPCGPWGPRGPCGPAGPPFLIASWALLSRSPRRSEPFLTFWVLMAFLWMSAEVIVLSLMSLDVISDPATAPPPAASARTVAAVRTVRA